MKTQPSRFFLGAVSALLLTATIALSPAVATAQNEKAKPEITLAQLVGPWQIAVAGNTGCGQSSFVFTGNLNASGESTGTLTSNSGCGPSETTQNFTITSLSANGSGTAGLTCGNGCGWTFTIQVSQNKQVINLVDITDGNGNYLAGTAVKQ
jgi:hypothetical protein